MLLEILHHGSTSSKSRLSHQYQVYPPGPHTEMEAKTSTISNQHRPEPPYSIYTKNEKWVIVMLTAFSGLFSPLTASIYFPAIPAISKAFRKSIELINLTVTMYMILQGVAPMVWGTISDRRGRRPITAICLLILSLSCVGLALTPTSDYWLLMVLRCLQAAGSASTIAIGAGVIGDISTREERGGFFGFFTLGPMVGPSIGPVIGGVLSDKLGWRAIFWFLTISSSVCLLIIILFLPETLRALVGNGSVVPSPVHRPVFQIIGHGRRNDASSIMLQPVPQNPFRLFLNVDVLILLAINAIICSVYYGVIATMSTLLGSAYPFLNETTIGLCFLAAGGGMILGSSISGRVLDREYRAFKAQEEFQMATNIFGIQVESSNAKDDSFPIEKARLRLLPYHIVLLAAACAAYGWCLQKRVNIAGPLILQIIVGYASIAIMNATSTLMIDLAPSQSSSITACNNLVRCTLSAVLVSVIQLILDGIGIGWTYVLLCGVTLISVPLIFLSIKLGPACRARRRSAGQ